MAAFGDYDVDRHVVFIGLDVVAVDKLEVVGHAHLEGFRRGEQTVVVAFATADAFPRRMRGSRQRYRQYL